MLEAQTLDQLADQIAVCSYPGDLVLAMGAGDINGLWERLGALGDRAMAQGPLAQAT